MFSALKFVAAGVIVALFGGFLLAGILTTQPSDEMAPAAVTESPSPMTTEELLSGMVTEEVEPGVFRVVNDGVRDITHSIGGPFFEDTVMVDGTGGVWRSQPRGRVYRLGTEQQVSTSGLVDLYQDTIEATPDGRLVTVAAGGLRVFDGESWSPDEYGIGGDYRSIAVQEDGTVWLSGETGLVQANTDRVPEYFRWPDTYDGDIGDSRLALTADGEVWLMGRERDHGYLIDAFLRFDGADWKVVPAPDGGALAWVWNEPFDVGPDGTLWTVADWVFPHRSLARYDDSGWTIFGETDGVRPWGGQDVFWSDPVDMVGVAPDGAAWVNASAPGDHWTWGGDPFDEDTEQPGPSSVVESRVQESGQTCDGLGRYDGESWASYLSGMCVRDYVFTPDGAVWVVAREPRVSGLDTATYVITPEAVAATLVADEG